MFFEKQVKLIGKKKTSKKTIQYYVFKNHPPCKRRRNMYEKSEHLPKSKEKHYSIFNYMQTDLYNVS